MGDLDEKKVQDEADVKNDTADTKTEDKKKPKKEKASVDVNKVMGQAKSGVSSLKSNLENFFKKDFKKTKLVLIAILCFQTICAFSSGFITFLLSLILTIIAYIGINSIEVKDENNSDTE